ncbi:MAG: molybdopterin-guanine dinucleotide biosynthesis protein A [Gammaproteobacteria bacterium]
MRLVWAMVTVTLSSSVIPTALTAADRHEGYYYPTVTSRETYTARAVTLPDSARARRIGFVVGLTKQQHEQAYPPEVAVFTKGAEAEKMIIVALNRNAISNVYQARALIAQMTAVARATEVFIHNRVEQTYTFLDLLKLMGYEQLTVSDGHSYAHQIKIE